jgi:uncharacterized protein YodC (DUF2158 family)
MFADGDEVILKSGGPVMTVEGTHARTGRIICIWFEGTKRMMSLFAPVTLKRWRGDAVPSPNDDFEAVGAARSPVTRA